MCAFSSGSQFAFASPAIPKLISQFGFTIEQVSYLTVIPPAAMVIATPLFCKLTDSIGRKKTLLLTGIIQLTGWLLVAFAENIWLFYLSRAMYGISDACIFAALPAYIAEVTTPKIRGLYGNMLVVSFFGQFLSNFVGYYCSISTTGAIMSIFPILYTIFFSFMPETPYYLVMIDNLDEAKNSLKKLRGTHDVTDEIDQIKKDVDRQLSETGNFKDLWLIQSNRKALFVTILTRGAYQLSGFVALVGYSQYVFQEAGGVIPNGIAAMVVSAMFCVFIIFSGVISDRLGRTKSMIISCSVCGLSFLAEAIYFYLQDGEIIDLSPVNWFPLAGIVVFAASFCAGLGVVPTLISGEIFSTSIRKHANGVANAVFAAYGTVLVKVFQVMMTRYGLWAPFLFFGVCNLANGVMSYFVVPETKDKTLEEIQQMLKRCK